MEFHFSPASWGAPQEEPSPSEDGHLQGIHITNLGKQKKTENHRINMCLCSSHGASFTSTMCTKPCACTTSYFTIRWQLARCLMYMTHKTRTIINGFLLINLKYLLLICFMNTNRLSLNPPSLSDKWLCLYCTPTIKDYGCENVMMFMIVWSKNSNTVKYFNITVFLLVCILKCNLFLWWFQSWIFSIIFQSSVSHDLQKSFTYADLLLKKRLCCLMFWWKIINVKSFLKKRISSYWPETL